MSCFHVSVWLRACSSRVLSRLRALFRVGAWCSDPGTHVLSFSFCVGIRRLTLSVLSRCVSVQSRVCLAARSSVNVCFVALHAALVFISCVHSCYVLCCVARSLCISLTVCFHVVMSCVNMQLIACSCSVLHMAGDFVLLAMCLCFCFV